MERMLSLGKLLRIIDRPIVPPDPKIVEYSLQRDEREQAYVRLA